MGVSVGATYGMGRGGTGLSSCASTWSGAAVTSKKDRYFIALPSIVPSRKRAPSRLISRSVERSAKPFDKGESRHQIGKAPAIIVFAECIAICGTP